MSAPVYSLIQRTPKFQFQQTTKGDTMTQPLNDSYQARREKALNRYEAEIEWYEKAKRNQRRLRQLLQSSVIVFSGLTPLLLLIDNVPKFVQALPAATAAILAALNAAFRVSENYARFSYTLEALKSEKFKFETKAAEIYGTKVNDQKALERFVSKMEELIISEVVDWRQVVVKHDEKNEQS
jgi:hypothetical protein